MQEPPEQDQVLHDSGAEQVTGVVPQTELK